MRPDWRPRAASRLTRSGEDPGSIEYSAVTQPVPRPLIHRGTSGSIDAVHSTRVRPKETRTDPSAISVKSRSKLMGRSSSAARPSPLMFDLLSYLKPPALLHRWGHPNKDTRPHKRNGLDSGGMSRGRSAGAVLQRGGVVWVPQH